MTAINRPAASTFPLLAVSEPILRPETQAEAAAWGKTSARFFRRTDLAEMGAEMIDAPNDRQYGCLDRADEFVQQRVAQIAWPHIGTESQQGERPC